MEVSTESLLAIGAIITGAGAIVSTIVVSRRTARKDALQSLQVEVERLNAQVEEKIIEANTWKVKFDLLYSHVLRLRKIISERGISIPDMPSLDNEVSIKPKRKKKN